MAALTVEKLIKERREILDMTLLAGSEGVDRAIQTNEIFRPGLALAGYTTGSLTSACRSSAKPN